jgi:agmatinase
MSSGSPRLIGLPYDASSSYLRGAAAAPPRIREALRSPAWNQWDERNREVLGPDGLTDAGDLDLSMPAEARDRIVAGVVAVLVGGARPIALGGDHSVTYPVLQAVASRVAAPLTVLHIDAHPDLYDEFEGDRYSHAFPFARIMEVGLDSRLIQVGIRTCNAQQRSQAERFGVEIIDMRAWVAGSRPQVEGAVYLSLDLDGLDPAFAPGVSHREPGGLSGREVIGLIQDAGGRLIGADVVEYNPGQDLDGVTAVLAAKLVKEIAGRMLADA